MNTDKHGYQYLQEYLIRNEFRYKEAENMLTFKIEGERFLCQMQESPAVKIFQAYGIPDLERQEVLELVNELNKNGFILKYYADFDGDAIICCQEFLPDETFTDEYWKLSIKMLKSGGEKLAEAYRALAEE